MSEELPRIDKRDRLVITEESLSEPMGHRSTTVAPLPSQASAPNPGPAPSASGPTPARPLPSVGPSKSVALGSGAFCSGCGNPVDPRAMVCPRCGVAAGGALAATAAVAALSMRHKSPGMAILLSLFLPGAGQLYIGRTGRGIAFFCGAVFAYVLIVALIGLILVPVVVIWAAIDANKLANAYNAQLLAGVPLA
jgi:TM2 domain-containing membrane protein YozV